MINLNLENKPRFKTVATDLKQIMLLKFEVHLHVTKYMDFLSDS